MEDFMFTKKEYDYTRSARREHARNLEYMEQPGVRVGISEIETERRSKINKAIIKMLIRVFKSESQTERVATWQDFKSFVFTHRIIVTYSQIKKMIKIWNYNNHGRKAA